MNTKTATKLVFICCSLFDISNSAWAQASRYVLDVRAIKGDEFKIVTLRDKKLNHIVWTRKAYNPQVTWSRDHRAVAVEGTGNILVWREGHKLRDFGLPAQRGSSEDYSMGCAWSPDKRRLLVRAGSSGSSMVGDNGAGSLFCFKLGSGNRYSYTFVAGDVTHMKWRDNRTILYEALDYNANMEATAKNYVWRAP